MRDPQNEYDVETYADIEITCSKCDEPDIHKNALLSGNQWGLAYVWTCDHCEHENIEDYETSDYVG